MDAVAEAEKLLKGLTDDVQAAEDAIMLASQMQTSLKQLGESTRNYELANASRRPSETLEGADAAAAKRYEAWLADVCEENRELHAVVDEMTTGLHILMSKYRTQVSALRETSSTAIDEAQLMVEKERARCRVLEQETAMLTAKVEEMTSVMCAASIADDSAYQELLVEVSSLQQENEYLREILKISNIELNTNA